MQTKRVSFYSALLSVLLLWLCVAPARAFAQQVGSISGTIIDAEFNRPVSGARVLISETQQVAETNEQGGFTIGEVEPGVYSIVIIKEGYTRGSRNTVQVLAGQVTSLGDVGLSGEFTELGPVVVQDLKLEAGSELQLLELRQDASGLLDLIGSDLISKSGQGDAAGILTLVPGATVQDNKAVIRGLPDRYVSSQLNGVRLPSADVETRAIDLDQFPSDVIESIQVSKTFTPDQQGDASGGAVNIVTKSIPDQNILQVGVGFGSNTQVIGSDFLSYPGADMPIFGRDSNRRDSESAFADLLGEALSTRETSALFDYSMDLTIGGRQPFGEGWVVGGIVNAFYSKGYSHRDNVIDDRWIAENPVAGVTNPLVPSESERGTPTITSLLTKTESEIELQLGGLLTLGLESDNHQFGFTAFSSLTTTDSVTLAEDTRGRAISEEIAGGTLPSEDSPFYRTEVIAYEERSIRSYQFRASHRLDLFDRIGFDDFAFLPPTIDYTLSTSEARSNKPDRRQISEWWTPEETIPPPAFPPGLPSTVNPATHNPLRAGPSIDYGNFVRIYETTLEEGDQISLNTTLPFEQWNEREGYLKFGLFNDTVDRTYLTANYTNSTQTATFTGEFDEFYSRAIEDGTIALAPITAVDDFDINYTGTYDIFAWYWMTDLPLTSWLSVIGGFRYESTDISIVPTPDSAGTFVVLPENDFPVTFAVAGDRVNANFSQEDILPSLSFVITPDEKWTFRVAYNETIARQTFRELAPVAQQEFLGGDIFIGNPGLVASAIENYDFRVDYEPVTGTFLSFSLFRKDITDAIEYVQRFTPTVGTYNTAINFPNGTLQGIEAEVRQDFADIWEDLTGFSTGFNVTFIDSEVELPAEEVQQFALRGLGVTERRMINAPDYLINFNVSYDSEETGTTIGLFYTVKGETLVSGAGIDADDTSIFIPDVVAEPYDTLNLTLTQRITDNIKVKASARNLTDPTIKTVFRSDFTQEATRSSFRNGIDLSLSITGEFEF